MAITQAGISVVWIRGFDRQKSHISAKQLHKMLAVKLDEIAAEVASAAGPRYFLLYMKAGDKPVLTRIAAPTPPGNPRP
jgi:hypothetical protein